MHECKQYIVKGSSQSLSSDSDISVGAYYKNKFDEIINNDPNAVAFVSLRKIKKDVILILSFFRSNMRQV